MKRLFTLLIAAIITATPYAIAQNVGHPLIKGFEGSEIIKQEVAEFDEQQLVIGKVQQDGTVWSAKTEKLEGKVTRIDYQDPPNRSSLERIRNYELALKKSGFEIVFICSKEECGPEIVIPTIGYYPPERYLTARMKRKEGNIWVGVYIAAGSYSKIIIVEEKPMETDLVKVTADILKTNILKEGHMALYEIYFDTGKSEIKTESERAISSVADYLKENPEVNVYIVGHTDNVGDYTMNQKLSKVRGESVKTYLVSKYQISATRLTGEGAGPICPVTSNDTEEGRAINRRVEIVKK
jgi:outer membrane protein OmpA-like peptidoglycan-associated protein